MAEPRRNNDKLYLMHVVAVSEGLFQSFLQYLLNNQTINIQPSFFDCFSFRVFFSLIVGIFWLFPNAVEFGFAILLSITFVSFYFGPIFVLNDSLNQKLIEFFFHNWIQILTYVLHLYLRIFLNILFWTSLANSNRSSFANPTFPLLISLFISKSSFSQIFRICFNYIFLW